MLFILFYFTYSLSVSKGIFLGTLVSPRLEQSTVAPMQVHTLGHLTPVKDKWATSSASASQQNDDSTIKHPTKTNGTVVIARMVFANCLFTSNFGPSDALSLFFELIEISADYEEDEVGNVRTGGNLWKKRIIKPGVVWVNGAELRKRLNVVIIFWRKDFYNKVQGSKHSIYILRKKTIEILLISLAELY